MTVATPVGSSAGAPGPGSPLGGKRAGAQRGDRIFSALVRSAGLSLFALLAAIAVFLVVKALPALQQDTSNFFTTQIWNPDDTPAKFGIAALAVGTLTASALALLMAVPVAIGVALFISHYAPRRLATPLGYVVDLLAAVPSVVYGLWGLIFLVPHLGGFSQFLSTHLGWIPLFNTSGTVAGGKSIFAASVVLAVMILPIIAALSREVFLQVPTSHMEAALALGATRWEMVRTAVLPYGRPGVITGVVLGFGRALGETIAVALVLSSNYVISAKILAPGGNTIAANVANRYGEAGQVGVGALIASGLVLFVVTLVINFTARAIIGRRRDFRASA